MCIANKFNPFAKMKALVWIAALLFLSVDASAQTPCGNPSSGALQSCFIGTPAATWTKMKLTSDQKERLGRVQEACKTECDAANEKKGNDAISHSSGDMIITELKNILTMDQYAAWLAYCEGAGGGASPK
ncbi:MAG: hypothetical protein ACOH13_02270 [Flavobacteriales bacterium]